MTRALRHALHVEELDVKRSWLVIVTCLWSASTAVAQDIERVEVRGNHRVDAETIRAAVATKTGQPLDPQRLRSDLRAIWKLGMFSDVRAVSDGGALVFEVVERPAIRKVLVAGNHELALDKIDEVIELKRDAAVDEVAIRRSRDKIAELYVAQGFAFAAVDSALLPADGGAVDVKFTVDEHARVTVSDIVFTGNRAIESGELRKHMSTSPPGALSFLTGAVLGGISDIRGYQPRSLGPHLWSQHAGDVGQPLDPLAIGGNLQLVGNVELEFPLMKSIGLSGVAFFDIGNAYNLESRFCSQPGSDACTTGLDAIGGLRKSVGLGVRWRSPLGPLRFEWGTPSISSAARRRTGSNSRSAPRSDPELDKVSCDADYKRSDRMFCTALLCSAIRITRENRRWRDRNWLADFPGHASAAMRASTRHESAPTATSAGRCRGRGLRKRRR